MEKYYLWMLLAFGESAPENSELLERFGTAERVYEAFNSNISLVGAELTARADKTDLSKAEKLLGKMLSEGVSVIPWESALYPAHLRKAHEAPCVLFALGDTSLLQKRLVTVVGSRAVTGYTAETIPHIIERLDRKYAVAGTLSDGCDQLTCLNAIKYGVSFAEVLPCGFSQTYPAGSKTLRKFLLANGGLLLTEFLPKTKAGQGTFLRRSRILGGISYVTLVMQAGEKSGALLTAEHSYAPLFVPPNDIFRAEYAGAVTAVRNGAKLYLDENSIDKAFERAIKKEAGLGAAKAEKQKLHKTKRSDKQPEEKAAASTAEMDIATEPEPKAANSAEPTRDSFGSEEEFTLYGLIAASNEPISPELLTEKSGISPSRLAEALLDLEIGGFVKAAGNRYSLAR